MVAYVSSKIMIDSGTSSTTIPPYDEKIYHFITDDNTGKTCEAFSGDIVLTPNDIKRDWLQKEDKPIKNKEKWYKQYRKQKKDDYER